MMAGSGYFDCRSVITFAVVSTLLPCRKLKVNKEFKQLCGQIIDVISSNTDLLFFCALDLNQCDFLGGVSVHTGSLCVSNLMAVLHLSAALFA